MYCENCGVKLPAGAETCPDCGAKISQPVNNETNENQTAQNPGQQGAGSPPPNFNGANPNCPPPNFNGANPNCPPPPPNFNGGANPYYYPPYPPYQPPVNPNDKKSTGLNVLAFFFPIIGLILWLATRDDKPIRAKSIGKSALIGFICGIIVTIISYLVVFLGMFGAMNSYDDIYDYDSYSYNDYYDYDFDQTGLDYFV
ncbi:MAG: hypothetical protein LUH82_00890 [Clostridiales bacterium]|nr:hypothetical protein [Clostridiales bacterium]